MKRRLWQAWRRLGKTGGEQTLHGLLLVILFSLPFGVVALLSEQQANVAGRYNSFAVPKLYLLEILIVAAFTLWAYLRKPALSSLRPYRWLLVAMAIALLSFLWSPYPLLALVSAGHLVVAFMLLWMLAAEFRDLAFLKQAAWAVTLSGGLQAVWGIAQFLLQHDLGLAQIGESVLGPSVTNVAKVSNDGDKYIRAYGSLPHPNLLAAYLVAAIFCVGTVIFWPLKKATERKFAILNAGLLIVLGSALVLTFSRIALIITLINGLLVAFFSYRKWHRLPAGAVVAAATVFLVAVLSWPYLMNRTTLDGSQETGVTNRTVGVELAGSMISDRPVGVGAGNFVVAIDELRSGLPDYQHQPVHNALLLVAAELGAVAALLVIAFLARVGWLFHFLKARRREENTLNLSLLAVSGAFVAMGMFDHFFWSLPQGLWLACALLAAVISRIPEKTFNGEAT